MANIAQQSLMIEADLKEEAYRLVYNQINHSERYILDIQGKILQVKSGQAPLSEYTAQELVGQPCTLLFALEEIQHQVPQKQLSLAYLQGEISFFTKIAKKNGQLFCASVKLRSLKNEAQTIVGFAMIVKDITYKIVYEDLYERIQNRYRNIFENQIFENQIVGIFRVSLQDFHLMRANLKTLEICGIHTKEEFVLEKFFLNEEERRRISQAIRQNIFLDKYHIQAQKSDGTRIWASITCLVKKIEGYIEGIIVDVTESETRLQALEKANFELDTFIYHASHDLRSPLLSILGLMNILREEENVTLRKKYLDAVENRVKHLDKLVQDLLAISRNERTTIEIEKFDFRAEIKQILRDYYFLDEYRNIDVYLDLQESVDFYTDVFRLRVILNNLISNAFKYRNPILSESLVRIEIKIDAQNAHLLIIDNGIGIDEKYLRRIFEMFFRASEQSKGSGLGLYIVKTMIEKLKGKIEVKSELNKGTTFKLEFPNLKS